MGLELALLSGQTGARALRFDLRRQVGGLRLPGPKSKPHHSHRPELRRDARASGDEASQHLSLRLRNRQPEEGADPQRTRAFFFQFS